MKYVTEFPEVVFNPPMSRNDWHKREVIPKPSLLFNVRVQNYVPLDLIVGIRDARGISGRDKAVFLALVLFVPCISKDERKSGHLKFGPPRAAHRGDDQGAIDPWRPIAQDRKQGSVFLSGEQDPNHAEVTVLRLEENSYWELEIVARSPTLRELSAISRFCHVSVIEALRNLERAGWLRRSYKDRETGRVSMLEVGAPPPAGMHVTELRYVLFVPGVKIDAKRHFDTSGLWSVIDAYADHPEWDHDQYLVMLLAKTRGREAFMGIGTLSEEIGRTKKTTRKKVVSLEAGGAITLTKKGHRIFWTFNLPEFTSEWRWRIDEKDGRCLREARRRYRSGQSSASP